MRLSREELREHERKLRRIEIQGERKLLEEELKQKREEYWPKKKPPNASKVALAYIFLSCTAVQLYSMAAMWHFADLSALYSLIGATVGETIAYAAKATKENTEGGIVHDMAMRGPETCSESQEGPSEAAKG